jgi:hypothetical protein
MNSKGGRKRQRDTKTRAEQSSCSLLQRHRTFEVQPYERLSTTPPHLTALQSDAQHPSFRRPSAFTPAPCTPAIHSAPFPLPPFTLYSAALHPSLYHPSLPPALYHSLHRPSLRRTDNLRLSSSSSSNRARTATPDLPLVEVQLPSVKLLNL